MNLIELIKVNDVSIDGYQGTYYSENPEWVKVILDSDEKILAGIKADGTKVIGGDLNVGGTASISGDAKILGNMEVSGVSYKIIENPEYLAAWVDAEDKVIFGLKSDGKTYVGDADFLKDIEDIKAFFLSITEKNIDWDALSSITAVENPEFIEAKTDSEGKLLAGRTIDGAAFENVGLTSQRISTTEISIDGHIIKNIEDIEKRTEILTDSNGKIISYRDDNGIKYEEVGIKTNHFELTKDGMIYFQKSLKDNGFNLGGSGNWSDYISNDGDNPLHLPIPNCAILNFTNIPSFPTTKTSDLRGIVEYNDMIGNYFKKKVILNAHGQVTLSYPKKNITVDFLDDDYVNSKGKTGDALKISFGDWIPQDSFHLKAYYTDNTKCLGAIGYKIYYDFVNTRPLSDDFPYREHILDVLSDLSVYTSADAKMVYEYRARCFPDGFPCIVYLNGEFYGIFAFLLKKHRDNYLLDSKTAENVHIEGQIDYDIFFNGTIKWYGGAYGLEVRNPKNLYYQNSITGEPEEYDFDKGHNIGPIDDQEIMGTDSAYYDASNKDMKRCANAKKYIEKFAEYIPTLKTLKDNGATTEEIKAELSAKFGMSFMIDYLIFLNLIGNGDSISNNCQWTTYDGVKWYPNPYDLNNAFIKINNKIGYSSIEEDNLKYPFGWCWTYFEAEMAERYQELKNAGIIDAKRLTNFIINWMKAVGVENYKKENQKWPQEAMLSSVLNVDLWKEITFDNSYPEYNNATGTQYNIGDKVKFNLDGTDKSFEAIKDFTVNWNTPLMISANRNTSIDWLEIFEHNISKLDTWLNI